MIETISDFNKFHSENADGDWIVHIVPIEDGVHPSDNIPSVLFIRNILTGRTYSYAFDHPDSPSKISDCSFIQVIWDKTPNNIKWALDGKAFRQLGIQNVNDANLCGFFKNNDILELSEYETPAHNFVRRNSNGMRQVNKIIPLLKHKEMFEDMCVDIEKMIRGFKVDDSYTQFNDIIHTLGQIEKNGIYVDRNKFLSIFGEDHKKDVNKDNIIHTQYHPYHLSGRPSNTFNGINYSALNKSDGTRSFIKSRYGAYGKLILIDYKSYHPRLLSNIVDYKIPADDVYAYLASHYFNKSYENVDEYDISNSKQITFEMLYGGIKPEYLHIKFLKKIQDYMDTLYETFNNCGYVETLIFKRKIQKEFASDMTPNKLLNYILQSHETERNMDVIKNIFNAMENRKSKIVLYQYDSILLDFHKDDVNFIDIIKETMDYKNYPLTISIGDDFHDMKKM